MFISIDGLAHHVGDMEGQVLLSNPAARIATISEAATCISRYVFNGDPKMNEANDDFKRIYSSALSAPEIRMPVPNQAAAKGMPRVSTMIRDMEE